MSSRLEQQFHSLSLPNHRLSAPTIAAILDLTRLDTQATASDIETLIQKAKQDQVAAVCVLPEHLEWVPCLTPIQRATVVNFPRSDQLPQQVLQDIEQAITHHNADEIDYVLAYPIYLTSQKNEALAWCRDAYQLCRHYGRLFKVILETGALGSLEIIHRASCDVMEAGCDMLKTSTGKIAVGATLPAVFAILKAIQDREQGCGIKCSGGIRSVAQASQFIHLAEHVLEKSADKTWFRIGTSGIQ